MTLLKHFWIYALALLVLVAVVLGLAIWDSSTSSITSPSIVSDSALEEAGQVIESDSEKPVPSDFPAPAKKLHQLINESDSQLSDAQSLDEKIKQLDKQLADINEQLKAQGIDAPAEQGQPTASSSDTQTRLQAIKDHINKKTNP
jgi:hypothetical protein